MKRFISLFLILLIALSFVSCARQIVSTPEETTIELVEEETTQKQKPIFKVSLGYYSNDSFNPYKAEGYVNSSLSGLFCDSLICLDSAYKPEYIIAEESNNENNTLLVKIKDNVNFSDGSSLTSSDVVYSFDLAKKSKAYSSRLENFSSASAGDNEVSFHLNTSDIYAINCLDFPIIKSGTGNDEIVISSGHYVLNKNKGVYSLKENKNYSFDEKVSIEGIDLVDISSVDNKLYGLQIGDLSFYYDSSDDIADESVKINANSLDVSMNDLVFLSFNSKSVPLSLRQAILKSIDRQKIISSIYGYSADFASSPFNPLWDALSKSKTFSPTGSQSVLSGLEKNGYKNNNNVLYDSQGSEVKLDLLVCSEDEQKVKLAKEIVIQLKKLGIETVVQQASNKEYFYSLNHADYDMYLGEIRLNANMSLSSFFVDKSSANYGIDDSDKIIENYQKFTSGQLNISTFNKLFDDSAPFVPLCYLKNSAYYSRNISFSDLINENSPFRNVYSWGNAEHE